MLERSNTRAPVVFIGHGSPTYALWPNPFTPTWKTFVDAIDTPRAVLAVSAHWYGPGLAVTAQDQPPTIHDFGGFPPEFFAIQYPAPGAPWLVDAVAERTTHTVTASHDWGLDHGTWTTMMHLWPDADVPVAQLRVDSDLSAPEQIELGRQLSSLRDEGVLLLGSGNIVHNLAQVRGDQIGGSTPAAEWNTRFDDFVAEALVNRDLNALAAWERHDDARLAAPTPEHFVPALVIVGASLPDDQLTTITEGADGYSLSMRSFAFA